MRRNLRSSALFRLATWAAAGAWLTVSACGSKGAVDVTADLHDPEMIVGQASGLAAVLTGGFGLRASLGSSAAATDITLGKFTLVNADQVMLVVLKFTTNPAAPYHLEPGGNLDLTTTIADQTGTPGQVLTKSEETAVCAARAAVQVVGSITGAHGQVPVTSPTFKVACP